jgi:hypothetical protein
MGLACSRSGDYIADEVSSDIPDREIYEFLKQSVEETQPGYVPSQHHLLFRSQQHKKSNHKSKLTELNNSEAGAGSYYSTRLLLRRHTIRLAEEGFSGTHIYAMRWAAGLPGKQQKSDQQQQQQQRGLGQEQCPREQQHQQQQQQLLISEAMISTARPEDREPKSIVSANSTQSSTDEARDTDPILSINHLFQPSTMAATPKRKGTFFCSPGNPSLTVDDAIFTHTHEHIDLVHQSSSIISSSSRPRTVVQLSIGSRYRKSTTFLSPTWD